MIHMCMQCACLAAYAAALRRRGCNGQRGVDGSMRPACWPRAHASAACAVQPPCQLHRVRPRRSPICAQMASANPSVVPVACSGAFSFLGIDELNAGLSGYVYK